MKHAPAFFAGLLMPFALLGVWGVGCSLWLSRIDGMPESDDLPWEAGVMECDACGLQAVIGTHFPTIRRDLKCPQCHADALNAVEDEWHA